MKNNLIKLWLFWITLFVLGSFTVLAKDQLFKAENTYKYDLKNLDTDLKKDYPDDDCSIVGWKYKNCNWYQIKSNDDKLTREYIWYLKNNKTAKAADLLNNNFDKQKDRTFYTYPDIGLVWTIWKTTAYKNWIIWLENQWQDTNIKFYYITVKNNILYKFKSTNSIYFADNKIFIWEKSYKIDLQNKSETQYLIDYLKWKEKSKELDQRQKSFKAKVDKLFK